LGGIGCEGKQREKGECGGNFWRITLISSRVQRKAGRKREEEERKREEEERKREEEGRKRKRGQI